MPRELSTDEMFEAMQELAEPHDVMLLRRRDCYAIGGNTKPWYVRLSRVEISSGAVLKGICGDGVTPQDAISSAWRAMTAGLAPIEYLVVNAMSPDRRAHRWNGSRWVTVKEESCRSH